MGKAKILVVEHEPAVAKDLQRRLEQMGYDVPCAATSGEEALNRVREHKPGLVLMNILLTGAMDGIEAADRIRSADDIPIIYLTENADEEILERAKITEPFGYLIKPVSDRELQSNIEISIYKHRTDRKLREKEKWHSTVLSSIGDAVIITDTEGNIRFMNPAAESLTGWGNHETAGKPAEDVFNIINEETGGEVENPVQKVLKSGMIAGLANHTVLIARDGTKIPIDDSGAPIIDEKGNITGVVLVFHSIVERKKAETLILQAKQDWEDTFNTITDMITIHDKDFNIIRANKAAEKLLGLPLLNLDETKCFKYYHGTQAPPGGCPSCQCFETRERTVFEIFEPHLNMYIEIMAIPRFDNDNHLTGLIHVVRDITERKKIEDEIKKAKVEWEMTFDSASELIILVDKELNISRCNKSFAEFTQRPIREIIGKKCSEFFPCDIMRDNETEPASMAEIQTESGHWLYLSSYSILDDKGKFLHTIIIATDITDLKITQKRLLQSEKELKNRVKELEDFYDMAVGRELKMKELKSEIAKLNKRLSEEKEN
ncbi:MAG TPA: PAS domain S-box protein [Nitrospirae bacterium]|nr:putative transcriptional regulatory protein pdtaR [bacterium BMS3Abin06]HDH12941.1 PAS domain S-box protein [Nitrospirota bacterium]